MVFFFSSHQGSPFPGMGKVILALWDTKRCDTGLFYLRPSGWAFKDNMDRTWKHQLPALSTATPRFSAGVIGRAKQNQFTK